MCKYSFNTAIRLIWGMFATFLLILAIFKFCPILLKQELISKDSVEYVWYVFIAFILFIVFRSYRCIATRQKPHSKHISVVFFTFLTFLLAFLVFLVFVESHGHIGHIIVRLAVGIWVLYILLKALFESFPFYYSRTHDLYQNDSFKKAIGLTLCNTIICCILVLIDQYLSLGITGVQAWVVFITVVLLFFSANFLIAWARIKALHKRFTSIKTALLEILSAYLIMTLFNLLGFAIIYYFFGICCDKEPVDFTTSLYFSVVTWTTLGYGDLSPLPELRLVAAFEAFMGYLYMAVLVGIALELIHAKLQEKKIKQKLTYRQIRQRFFYKTSTRRPYKR